MHLYVNRYSVPITSDKDAIHLNDFQDFFIINCNSATNFINYKNRDIFCMITNENKSKKQIFKLAVTTSIIQCPNNYILLTEKGFNNVELDTEGQSVLVSEINIDDYPIAKEINVSLLNPKVIEFAEEFEILQTIIRKLEIVAFEGYEFTIPINYRSDPKSIRLSIEAVHPIDSIIRMNDRLIINYTNINQRLKREDYQMEDNDSYSLEFVGGNKKVIEELALSVFLNLDYPDIYRNRGINPTKGILMYGPPGCGKTLIARSVAQMVKAKFFSIKGPEMFSEFVGRGEGELRKIFSEARKCDKSVIFIDELDALAPNRDSPSISGAAVTMVNTLLNCMDGIDDNSNILVLGATNRPQAIDPAIRRPGRFDVEFEVPYPNHDDRKDILHKIIKRIEKHSDNNHSIEIDYNKWADNTEGFSGADLNSLCERAGLESIKKIVKIKNNKFVVKDNGVCNITDDDFESAFKDVQPSLTRELEVINSEIKWNDVVTEGLKYELEKIIELPLINYNKIKDLSIPLNVNLLIEGESGSGKTMTVKALANKLQMKLLHVNAPDLISGGYGDISTAFYKLFYKAEKICPAIVLLENIDNLYPSNPENMDDKLRLFTSLLLSEMDRIKNYDKLYLISTVINKNNIPKRLLEEGGFTKIIKVKSLSRDSIKKLLETHIVNYLSDLTLLEPIIDKLVDKYSASKIVKICNDVKLNVAMNKSEIIVEMDDFINVIDNL